MLRVALGKTLNMFNPEEVTPEIRFTMRNRQRPGQDNKIQLVSPASRKAAPLSSVSVQNPRQYTNDRNG
jgi:hypothetical protein